MEQSYSNFGVTIIRHDENYFLQYDNGQIVSTIKNHDFRARGKRTNEMSE